jgi:hypothetical protein
LALAGGMEMSRRQLQIYKDALSDDNMELEERMEQIPEDISSSCRENGMDSSNGEKVSVGPLENSTEQKSELTTAKLDTNEKAVNDHVLANSLEQIPENVAISDAGNLSVDNQMLETNSEGDCLDDNSNAS